MAEPPSEPGAAIAYIALGANLGDAVTTIRHALESLRNLPRTRVLARSSLYRSAPVDAGGPDYINAVAQVQTRLAAIDLLRALQALEHLAGRERPGRNAPRTLDLDLLLHGDQPVQTQDLTLPHPRMNERAFVLVPLAEIAPERVDPALLAAVADQRIERLPPAG